MRREEAIDLLKKKGIKVTRQRVEILSVLSNALVPVSADEIYGIVVKNGKMSINLSTIYRVLDALTQKGILLKSNLNLDGRFTYEFNRNEHKHHIICIECNEIIPVKGCPLMEYESELEMSTGYKIMEHSLELRGICPKCQKKRSSDF
ncbi:MAG: Fur family transcriptional regulator [Gudongella sp.]|jgi:Fur family ferric uptake transcriptional regulator|nr:Fur family transcriptional regulator [Gudongella sp.]